MASGSRLEADHRHLSLNSRARSLGIEERDEGRGGGGYAPRHGTRSLRSRDRVHRAVEAARRVRGGRVTAVLFRHLLLASFDNKPCKDPRCHLNATPVPPQRPLKVVGARRPRPPAHHWAAGSRNPPPPPTARVRTYVRRTAARPRWVAVGGPEAWPQVHRQKPWRVPAEPTVPRLYSQVYGFISRELFVCVPGRPHSWSAYSSLLHSRRCR